MQQLHARAVVTASCYNCCTHPSGSVVHSYLFVILPCPVTAVINCCMYRQALELVGVAKITCKHHFRIKIQKNPKKFLEKGRDSMEMYCLYYL